MKFIKAGFISSTKVRVRHARVTEAMDASGEGGSECLITSTSVCF